MLRDVVVDVARPPSPGCCAADLSHRGRGGASPRPLWERSRAKRAGEGGTTALFVLSATSRCTANVGAATFTRPFGATSPVKGEMGCYRRQSIGPKGLVAPT